MKVNSKDFKDITEYFEAISQRNEYNMRWLRFKECEADLEETYNEWLDNEREAYEIWLLKQ